MFCEPPLNFNSSTFLAQVSQSCIMPVIESCEEDKGCGKVPKESLRASREIMNDLTSTAAENARFPKNIILFPMKLRRLLDDAVEEGNEHIISWLPNGKAFKIHDSDAFTDVILKRYFRQTRFKSFTRQLYHYGFAKTNNDSDHGTFSHPHFQRDDIKSCLSIHRKRARVHIPKTTTTPEVLQSHDRSASPIRYPREKPIVLGRGDSPKYVEDKSRLPLPSCDNISRHLPSERPIRVNHAAIGSSTDSTFISAEASGAKNPRFINSTFESIAQGQRCLVQDEKFSNLQISKTLSDDWLGCLELWFQCTRVGYDGGSNDDENLMEPRTLEEMALYPISAISFSRDDY